MPTKLNFGGEQQPYVPKGSGDPSGEYADEQGANVNFKVAFAGFGKKPAEKEGHVSVKVAEKTEEEKHKDFDSFLSAHYLGSPSIKEKIRKDFTLGTPEGKKMVLEAINGTDTTFQSSRSDFCLYNKPSEAPSLMLSSLNSKRNKAVNYSEGGVFYHEMGHAIDIIYGSVSLGGYTGQLTVKKTASSSVKLSNGLTLNQTIVRNMGFIMFKDAFAKAKKEVEQRKAEILARSPNYAKDKQELAGLKEQYKKAEEPFAERQNELNRKWRSGIIESEEFFAQSDKVRQEETNDPTLTEIRKKRTELGLHSSIYQIEADADAEIDREFGDVSDMFQGAAGEKLTGMGHGQRYFGAHDSTKRGEEFFAEYNSAKATNPASLKRIREYFPEQAKAAEELYQKIKNGEIKKWNQN